MAVFLGVSLEFVIFTVDPEYQLNLSVLDTCPLGMAGTGPHFQQLNDLSKL